MAGCFQINNAKDLIVKYFTPDEVIAVDEPDQWINSIEHFLQNDNEISIISKNARKKALMEHTWHKRAETFINMINENIPKFNPKDEKTSIFSKFRKKLDEVLPPAYVVTRIRLFKFLR